MFLSGLTIQYMFYYEFNVEPGDLQLYKLILMSPLLFRFFFGVLIDTKIMSRKIYNFISNLISTIMLFSVGLSIVNTPLSIVLAIATANLFHNLVDSTLISYTLEQARNVPNGNEDMQSFRIVTLSISSTLGSIIATTLMSYKVPRYCFIFMGCTYSIATVQALFISKKLETNERANMKDNEILKYEQRQRESLRE